MTALTASSLTPADPPAAIECRYYAAMALPFGIDLVISAIFAWFFALPMLFLTNMAVAAVILLLGSHLFARKLFRPIRSFLARPEDFGAIERALTQLPIRSATVVMWLYLPILLFRMVTPLVFGASWSGAPMPTWTDAIVTVLVSAIFIFVVTYFLISGYLERLCRTLFERHGVNLGLFFGRFAAKVGVALTFSALAPLVLIAGDVASYRDERLLTEVAADALASAFGLAVVLYWVTRSLIRPLAHLDAGMAAVAAGNLEIRLPVTSNEEIGGLTAHFNRMVEGLRERQRIRATFGKYVSEAVASALLREAGDGRLQGETGTATLLFTDIAGFTTLSERLAPDTLIGVLNDYLAAIVIPIERHGGIVNGFSGDGLFASFNMPLAHADHARAAVAAALEIQEILAGRRFAGEVRLDTRIGINTGPVVGGTIGAGERLSYTLLGDAVNTAARLQELNKLHGTRILLAETTRRLAGDGFRFRAIGEVPIRGRSEPLVIHTVEAAAPLPHIAGDDGGEVAHG